MKKNTFDATIEIYRKTYKQKVFKLYGLDISDFVFVWCNDLKLNKKALIDLFIGYFDNIDLTNAINQNDFKLKIY